MYFDINDSHVDLSGRPKSERLDEKKNSGNVTNTDDENITLLEELIKLKVDNQILKARLKNPETALEQHIDEVRKMLLQEVWKLWKFEEALEDVKKKILDLETRWLSDEGAVEERKADNRTSLRDQC